VTTAKFVIFTILITSFYSEEGRTYYGYLFYGLLVYVLLKTRTTVELAEVFFDFDDFV
jgi:hypothetical protein